MKKHILPFLKDKNVLVALSAGCVAGAVVSAALWLALTHSGGSRSAAAARKLKFPASITAADFQTELDQKLLQPVLRDTPMLDKILRKGIDDAQTLEKCMTAVEITERQFPDRPDLHRIIADCAKILGIKKPRVFVADLPGMGAMTVNSADPVIILHASILRRTFSEAELRFIIGHEMGHIKCSHVKWTTLVMFGNEMLPDYLVRAISLPLLKWFRAGECSADNAGLLCCQDLAVAEQALARLLLGLPEDIIGSVNIDEFLKQREHADANLLSETSLLWQQITQTHPHIADRILQLRQYAASERYKTALGK